MGAGQCAHDLGPHSRPSPANKPIVAGRVRTEVIRQIAPWSPGSQHPEDAIEDAAVITRGTPRGLLGSIGLRVGRLNHGLTVRLNTAGQGSPGRYAPKAYALCSL